MKKVVMCIAVAAMAVVGYSAEVTWGAGNNWIKDSSGNNLARNTEIMIIMASDVTAVKEALAADTSISSYVLDTAKTSNTKGYVAAHEVTSSKFTAGQSYSLAALIVQGDDFVITGTQSFTAYTSGVDEASSASFSDKQGNAPLSAWGPKNPGGGGGSGGGGETIPEPTSGLLLLVGAGMLALRRKQK